MKLTFLGRDYDVDQIDRDTVRIDGREYSATRVRDGSLRINGHTAWAVRRGETRWVFVDGQTFALTESRPASKRRGSSHQGALTSPMPATVRKIAVAPGDVVKIGDILIVLEAMKMELPVRAPHAGTILVVRCREGELVQPGVALLELTED